MREIRSTRNGKSRKCEGTPLRRVLLKIRAQGTCRNGKLFRRRRDISAADVGKDVTNMHLRVLRDIIFISKCTLWVPRSSNEILYIARVTKHNLLRKCFLTPNKNILSFLQPAHHFNHIYRNPSTYDYLWLLMITLIYFYTYLYINMR